MHRKRRAALSPYFSKVSIRRLEPVITRTVENLLNRFERCGQDQQVVPLSYIYKAATSDIICEYCFGTSTGYLLRHDFNKPFFDGVASNLALAGWRRHIKWLGPLLNMIPQAVMAKMIPAFGEFCRMQSVSPPQHPSKHKFSRNLAMGLENREDTR